MCVCFYSRIKSSLLGTMNVGLKIILFFFRRRPTFKRKKDVKGMSSLVQDHDDDILSSEPKIGICGRRKVFWEGLILSHQTVDTVCCFSLHNFLDYKGKKTPTCNK